MTLQELEEKFNEGLFDQDHTPSGKISVSSIVYPCLRKAFYEKTLGQFYDIETAYDFWLGRAIHLANFLEQGEIELEWEGIIGRIDEYENGTLVEKKTCKDLPSSPYEHHITQLEYYLVLCKKNGMPVNDMWLLYLEKKYPAHKFFMVNPRPIETIEKEMIERKTILENALKKNSPPPRHPSWLCKYCPFAPTCFKKQNNEQTISSNNRGKGEKTSSKKS